MSHITRVLPRSDEGPVLPARGVTDLLETLRLSLRRTLDGRDTLHLLGPARTREPPLLPAHVEPPPAE
jgi:hypothetical protein